VRVITGAAKGRPLKSVKGREVRPTADRVKESLFNVLGPRVVDADFLDLFAGSGAVGIEALSRGAASCVFVELVTAHMKVVEENLAATALGGAGQVLRRDARSAAADLGRRNQQFDLIFVDPPYGQELVPAALAAIAEHQLLRDGGWVICEHHHRDPLPEGLPGVADAGGLTKFREVSFGETVLSFYRRSTGPDRRQAD
jgi:16S rRNA (guanine966-N2)-methyltransferase